MKNMHWIPLVIAAVVLAVIAGTIGYNAGVASGLEQSGKIITAPGAPYPYAGWHRPWGFGFLFVPLLFVFFWMALFRGACRGPWRRGHRELEQWHREAHERMWNDPSGGGAAAR